MKRRAFLTGITAPLVWACLAEAQQTAKVYRVGLIDIGPYELGRPTFANALRQSLRDHGWIDGQNIVVDVRLTEGQAERIPGFVAEFERLATDVVVTVSDAILEGTARATKTIPIVSATGGNPVKLGVAASLGRPGGNVTGLMNDGGPEMFGKSLEFLKEASPASRRLAILWDAGPQYEPYAAELKRAAKALGMTSELHQINNTRELENTLATLTKQPPDAMFVHSGNVHWAARDKILSWTAKNRTSATSDVIYWVNAGLLIAYGSVLGQQMLRAGNFVDRILRGARAGDLPIEQPTKYQLRINMKTARTLRLTIPPASSSAPTR